MQEATYEVHYGGGNYPKWFDRSWMVGHRRNDSGIARGTSEMKGTCVSTQVETQFTVLKYSERAATVTTSECANRM